MLGTWALTPESLAAAASGRCRPAVTNTEALGDLLYTDYFYLFQAAGLDPAGRDDRRDRAHAAPAAGVRRQSIAQQVAPAPRARPSRSRKVQPGSGV